MPLLTLTFGDESKEDSSVSFHTPEVTNLNYTGYSGDLAAGVADALKDAVWELTRSTFLRSRFTHFIEPGNSYPTDPLAQNEVKAMFRYRDASNNKIYRFEIPGYNLIGKIAGQDNIDLEATEVAALITALGDFRGPNGGAIEVLSGKLVGRNI